MHIDTLLKPISEANTCGDDLSFSNEFDWLQKMRKEDDPTLDQGAWVRDLKVADWPGVQTLATDLLINRTKDLRVAGWLTEALARNDGFSGLAFGLRFCGRLCELYWDQIHPLPDDGEFEQRIGNLIWLLSQTKQLCQDIPIISSDNRHFGRQTIEVARSRQAPHDSGREETTHCAPSLDQINKCVQGTPREFLMNTLAQAQDALTALAELQGTVDERLGDDGPGFVDARQSMEGTIHLINRLCQERGFQSVETTTIEPVTASTSSSAPTPNASGQITSRAHAINQLRLVADYFRKTEPHSPVAYLADKAAHWGDIPLHVWLRAVVKDQGTLGHIEELLGITPLVQSQDS